MADTEIGYIEPGSLAEEAGIEPGDVLLEINGSNFLDILEYRYLVSEYEVELKIKKKNGDIEIIVIENDYEDLGIEFKNGLIADAKSCRNKCIFCFIDQLPEGMLEVATQNRKNRRVICCTAQVFTRVNKGLREQVTNVYEPHTFLGCFTVVFKKKYKFDSEGQVAESKFKGMYCFVHTEELRNAYDTYKVIHTLAREGFKEIQPAPVTNVYVESAGRRK